MLRIKIGIDKKEKNGKTAELTDAELNIDSDPIEMVSAFVLMLNTMAIPVNLNELSRHFAEIYWGLNGDDDQDSVGVRND